MRAISVNDKASISKRLFAIFSVALMITISFQVICSPVVAESVDTGSNEQNDNTSNETVEPPPLYDELPAGTIASYDSDVKISTSDIGSSSTSPYLTQNSTKVMYWTMNGTYLFDLSSPYILTMNSFNAITLVKETYFTVDVDGKLLLPINGRIEKAVNETFETSYDLATGSKDVMASMDVIYEFADGKAPKITATVTDIDKSISDWHIVWVIIPNEDSVLRTTDTKTSKSIDTSISDLVGIDIPSSGSCIDAMVENDHFAVDWKDAGYGALKVTDIADRDGSIRPGMTVDFSVGTAIIDPTIICTSTATYPTGMNCQRKTFSCGGYCWLFYNSGNAICYRYSIDGMTWSNQMTIQGGTTPYNGFDVECRDGVVAVAWTDTSSRFMFERGDVQSNNIVWSGALCLDSGSSLINKFASVVIDDQGGIWAGHVGLAFQQSRYYIYAYVSLSGRTVDSFTRVASVPFDYGTGMIAFKIVPTTTCSVAFIVATDVSGDAHGSYIDISYATFSTTMQYPTLHEYNIQMNASATDKENRFSVVSDSDGTLYIAYQDTSGRIRFARITMAGAMTLSDPFTSGNYPTISLDSSGLLHIFYVANNGKDYIAHVQKPHDSGTWSSVNQVYSLASSSERIKSLTSWSAPADKAGIAWSYYVTSTSVVFASIPLPYGTTGGSPDPWNVDGLSPYASYFAQNGDYVNPGNGLMIYTQTDVSVPGRNGVDLTLSRIYQQPRYLSKADGTAYGSSQYPFSNLGLYWGLDLPWMDGTYVYAGNGNRFVIQWGNEGNSSQFVNHDVVHFVLNNVNKGGMTYYELITSSGLRCQFEHSSPYKLQQISDLEGYDPNAASYSTPLNRLSFTYSGNVLTDITDSGLGRTIHLSYNNGRLSQIVRPDGATISLTYSQVTFNGATCWLLSSVTDALGRVTSFTYNSTASYLLNSATYPTNAKVSWVYGTDNSASIEYRTYLVTSEVMRNATTSAIIRQTTFSYSIVNGKVIMTELANYDNLLAYQGSNVYTYQSPLCYSGTTILNSTRSVLKRIKTYYDLDGQPVRTDTYLGDSTTVNYTTYASYDEWGNVIFTQDALGGQTYTAYANGSAASSFKGGDTLTRTSSGLIFFEPFDTLDASSWIRDMGSASNMFDVGANPNSIAMKIVRSGTSGNAALTHTFTAQSGNFIVQTSFMSNQLYLDHIILFAGTNARVDISEYNGSLQYFGTDNHWYPVASCSANVWYDIALYVHSSSNTFDIYLNGVREASGLGMRSSGNIDRISFLDGPISENALWFANVRVYSSLTITVDNGEQMLLILLDGSGNSIKVGQHGTLTLDGPIPGFPPAVIKLVIPGGALSYSSPIMDVWGGDTYHYNAGLSSTSNFYANSVNNGLHDLVAGTLQYQDYGKTATEESYVQYNNEGNAVTVKSKLGSGWVYTHATYDPYGNILTSTDGSGVMTSYNYSSGTGYVYPTSSTCGQDTGMQSEDFETLGQWQSYSSRSWLLAQYTTDRSCSPIHSAQISSNGGGGDGQDYGDASMSKQYLINQISSVTTKIYVNQYSHDGRQWDRLDSGVRIRLYDSTGVNYANYTYWLACWYQGSNNRTTTDPTIKVVYGQPTMGTWLSVTMNPNYDFNGIDWTRCVSVKIELYESIQGSNGDQFKMYFDDLTVGWGGNAYVTTYSYNLNTGTVQSVTDPRGLTTSYQYDALGRVVRTTEPDGNYTRTVYDDAHNTATTYDEMGRKTVNYYDELGRLKSVVTYGSTSSAYSSVSYTYNWQDEVATYTNELDQVTTYHYDYLGRNTLTQYPNGGSTPDSNFDDLETTGQWQVSSTRSWIIGQYTTDQSYSTSHSMQLSFSGAHADGQDSGSVTVSRNFNVDHVSQMTVEMYVAAYSHNGSPWDQLDSDIKIRLYDSGGNNYATYSYWLACWYLYSDSRTTTDPTVKIIYNRPPMNSWVPITLDPDQDFSGIDWSRCANVKVEFYLEIHGAYADQFKVYYDDLSINGAGGSTTTQTITIYDDKNCKVTSIDELGHQTVYIQDYLGRTTAAREYYSSTAYYQTAMAYDAVGDLLTVTQANGEVTHMYYDMLNRETRVVYPDQTQESWTYDGAGRVLTATSADGSVKTSSYDDKGQLIRLTGGSDSIVNTYDADGNVLTTSNSLGEISYHYNNRNFVDRMTQVISGTSYTFSYVYNAAGQLISEGYPDSTSVSYAYDNYGRVAQVSTSGTALLSLTYNLDSSIATKTYCGNTVTSYTYNKHGWVSQIRSQYAGQTFENLQYSYDAKGNVLSIVDSAGSAGTETYTYDALNRLTKAVGAWGTIQYGYDSVGNRLWINDGTNRTYSYSTYNKLSSDGSWTYSYDTDGNVIWKNSTSERYNCIYNSFGQMTSVIKWTKSGSTWSSSTIATYYYDANGQRARTVEGSTTTNFVYQGIDTACQFGSDGKTNKYIYVGGQLQLRTCSVSESYAYISDALGSTRFVLKNGIKDASNIVFSAVTYKPFGAVYTPSGTDRITFAGETTDSSTGLVYLSARYYDPSTGRFMALDPELGKLSMPQTMNRYVYCLNNPLLFTDPTGMDFLGDAWNGICGLGRSVYNGACAVDQWVNDHQATVAIVGVCAIVTVVSLGTATPLTAPIMFGSLGVGTAAVATNLHTTSDQLDPVTLLFAGLGGVGYGLEVSPYFKGSAPIFEGTPSRMLPDDAVLVVRGGYVNTGRWIQSEAEGISVSSAPGLSVGELASKITTKSGDSYKVYSYITRGELRNAGAEIFIDPLEDNPYHALIYPGQGGAPSISALLWRQWSP
jgi:RHS repeat-associated protein